MINNLCRKEDTVGQEQLIGLVPQNQQGQKSQKREINCTRCNSTSTLWTVRWQKTDNDSSPLQPFLLPLFLLSSTHVSLHNFPLSLNACQVSQSLPCFSVPLCHSACLSPSSFWLRIRSSSAIQTGNYISVLCWS